MTRYTISWEALERSLTRQYLKGDVAGKFHGSETDFINPANNEAEARELARKDIEFLKREAGL